MNRLREAWRALCGAQYEVAAYELRRLNNRQYAQIHELTDTISELRRNVIPFSNEAHRRYNEMETAQKKHSNDLAVLAIAKMNAEMRVLNLQEALDKCNRLRNKLASALPYETVKQIYVSEHSPEPEKLQPST